MFIEAKKYGKLRENAKNGDEEAKKILKKYLDGEDMSDLIEKYFKVEEKPEQIEEDGSKLTGLDKYLFDNGVTKDNPDYDEYVKSYNDEMGVSEPEQDEPEQDDSNEEEEIEPENPMQEVIEGLIDDEIEAAEGYDAAVLKIAADASIDEVKREGLIKILNDIRGEEIEHIKKIQSIAKDLHVEL